MVVSDRHHYVFMEVPMTASWAIRLELCAHYGAHPILHKHASLAEFHRRYPDKRDYMALATVRNPMDYAVSEYFKAITNHKGVYTSNRGLEDLHLDYADRVRYEAIKREELSFSQYFCRFYRRIYSNQLDYNPEALDRVMRFENIQESFSAFLEGLGLEQVRTLPVVNETHGRRDDWGGYYDDKAARRATRVFGPFLERWSYTLPESWGKLYVSPYSRALFRISSSARRSYASNFRYSNSATARLVRTIRANLAR
jgi:hypothetical protein